LRNSVCIGGFSLLKTHEETAAKIEKTEKSFVIKAKPIYKEVLNG